MFRTIKATKVYNFCGTPSITFKSEGSCLDFSQDIEKTTERNGLHPHSSPTHPPPWGCSEMFMCELFWWMTTNLSSPLLSCEMSSSYFITEIFLIFSEPEHKWHLAMLCPLGTRHEISSAHTTHQASALGERVICMQHVPRTTQLSRGTRFAPRTTAHQTIRYTIFAVKITEHSA